MIEKLFELEIEEEYKNAEFPEEEPTFHTQKLLGLTCQIDNDSKPIDMIENGIECNFEGSLDKFSPLLNRNAVYSKKGHISKLVS